jgi:Right handed beta helix region
MRGRFGSRGALELAASVVLALGFAPSAAGVLRDDTSSLQARLDAGGNVFLPRLPDGQCYRTRGLWVSRDDTSISSDGACIVALGPGEGRIRRADGSLVRATAVFFLDHSEVRKPLPVRVSINDLHITVPGAAHMNGISIVGHEVTLSRLTIDGAPLTDVVIGSGVLGAGGMTARVTVSDSRLSGGQRDVVSAFGPVGLRVERNALSGGRRTSAAGLHVTAADRGQPTLDVQVHENVVTRNAGPGIFLDLAPANGRPVLASGIDVGGNRILGNGRRAPAGRRAGILVLGGQDDGKGAIAVHDNLFRANRGPAVLRRAARVAKSPRVAPVVAPGASVSARDDTPWLQARLDRGGGTINLPRLPNDQCYATRGLWVSHDDTTITSDGACIVSLGLGPVRLHSVDGDPIAASAVFFVNRSGPRRPAPVGVTISNLRVVVPDGQSMYGVAINGHETTLSHLDIGGSPKDDVTISGRANGNSYAGRISILDCTLSGATRNAISATAVIGLRIERNKIQGVRDSPPGQPAAGIDVEPDDRGQPALDVHIVGNTIQDNAGPGILLELQPNEGPAVVATTLEISGNTIVHNSLKTTPPKRAGIVLAGGEDGDGGTLVLNGNVVRANGGPGILGSNLKLHVQASGNDLSGNQAGPSIGL